MATPLLELSNVDLLREVLTGWEMVDEERKPVEFTPQNFEAFLQLSGAVRDAQGDEIVTTPYIQLGASDSRWFTAISGHVYRFTPFHLTREERDGLHSHNERIRVDVWLRGIGFYRALVSAS